MAFNRPTVCLHCHSDLDAPGSTECPAVRCAECGFAWSRRRRRAPIREGERLSALPSDRYRVESLLHDTGSGRVYLARHLLLDERCVVKVLGPEDAGYSPQASERLARAARIGYRISHPGIIRVLDIHQVDETWYVVMEFVDGANLDAVLSACGPLVWMQAADIGRQAADALSAIHRAGFIHRDIKPANLLLQPDGSVKVVDLGLACSIEAEAAPSPDEGSGLVGTPPYVPPEQRQNLGPLNERADIYALGATLFHLVSGRPPQRSKSPLAYLCGEQHEPIVWDRDIAPPVPDWFQEVVETCLAQPSDLRIESATRLCKVLESHLPGPDASGPDRARVSAVRAPRIAVLPLRNEGGEPDDDWVGDALADHVSQRIVELQDVHLIDRHELAVLMERMLSRSPVAASDDQVCAVAELVGATTVVRGSYTLDGGVAAVEAYALRVRDRSTRVVLSRSGVLAQILGFEIDLGEAVIEALGFGGMPRASGRTFAKGTSNTQAQKHYAQAQRAFANGDYKAAIDEAQVALEADPGFIDLIGFIGVCYARQGQYDEAIEHHKRLKEIADETNDPYRLAEAVSNMGVMHYFKGDYKSAYELLNVANRLEQGLNLLPILAKNYNNLGFVLTKLERLEEADSAFGKATEIMTELGSVASMISSHNGRGEVALQRGRYQQAADHYRVGLDLANRLEDQVNVGICHVNLGRCSCHLGRLEEAESHFEKALDILKWTTFWHGLAMAYEHMAELMLLQKRADEALACMEQRTELAQRYKNRRIESACWEQKARAYELMGKAETAVACLRKSFEIANRPVPPAEDLYEYLEAVARRLPYGKGGE